MASWLKRESGKSSKKNDTMSSDSIEEEINEDEIPAKITKKS